MVLLVAAMPRYEGWCARYKELKKEEPEPKDSDIYKLIRDEHYSKTGKAYDAGTIGREIRRIKYPA